uniref:Bcl-2 homologous antagonist/killer n=1 Tax=Meleagris gallopavo TaxID=9103 RepID=H9H1N8_MELGA
MLACGQSSKHSTEEDQVAQQTEEVFRSYTFYRYQQEREEGGEEVPMDPEIMEIQQELGSIGSQVGRRLAIIGDDINKRYDAEFRHMLKSLQPTKENAYEYFTTIASSLFESGINWGRVIALLDFGYCMAIHVYQHGITGFLRRIARYVTEFMLCNRIARWIAQQGGWVSRGHCAQGDGAERGSVGSSRRWEQSRVWSRQDAGTSNALCSLCFPSGGCTRSGQCLHEVHAGGAGPGDGGAFSGTTLLQALTAVGWRRGSRRALSQTSAPW